MADVTTFDSRLRVENVVRDGLRWRAVREAPFAVYGLMWEDDRFRRIPKAVSSAVSEGVDYLNDNTAGGRVRFATDSDTIAVDVTLVAVGKMPHFALTGSVGFDVYTDEGEGYRYAGTLIPPFDVTDHFEAKVHLGARRRREVMLHFPLYSGVQNLLIGLNEDATLEEGASYADPRPIAFYGSSITQGGCASRPGNSYQAIASREMGFDFVNLGFSGCGCGEALMAQHIASLPLRAFVLDYDHNAPTPAHLRATHFAFYETVRRAHPTIPIVMMTRPTFRLNGEELERLAIVNETCENARAAGDTAVYVIDGRELVGEELAEVSTVDGVHPNDAGFYAMAKRLMKTLSDCL